MGGNTVEQPADSQAWRSYRGVYAAQMKALYALTVIPFAVTAALLVFGTETATTWTLATMWAAPFVALLAVSLADRCRLYAPERTHTGITRALRLLTETVAGAAVGAPFFVWFYATGGIIPTDFRDVRVGAIAGVAFVAIASAAYFFVRGRRNFYSSQAVLKDQPANGV